MPGKSPPQNFSSENGSHKTVAIFFPSTDWRHWEACNFPFRMKENLDQTVYINRGYNDSAHKSVLDYRKWAEVNRRMRKTERSWPKSCKESRAECAERLKQTAWALPRPFVRKAVEDMKRRCAASRGGEGLVLQELNAAVSYAVEGRCLFLGSPLQNEACPMYAHTHAHAQLQGRLRHRGRFRQLRSLRLVALQ